MPETTGNVSATVPTIELKKFKHAAFASEETHCFSAEVWVNGKRGFEARNDGHGGCDFYDAVYLGEKDGKPQFDHAAKAEAMATLEAWAKVAPRLVCDWNDKETGKPHEMEHSVETLIGEAVNAKLAEREVDKFVRKMGAQVFTLEDGKIMSWRKNPAGTAPTIAYIRAKNPGAVILNTLPEKEARAHFARALGGAS